MIAGDHHWHDSTGQVLCHQNEERAPLYRPEFLIQATRNQMDSEFILRETSHSRFYWKSLSLSRKNFCQIPDKPTDMHRARLISVNQYLPPSILQIQPWIYSSALSPSMESSQSFLVFSLPSILLSVSLSLAPFQSLRNKSTFSIYFKLRQNADDGKSARGIRTKQVARANL